MKFCPQCSHQLSPKVLDEQTRLACTEQCGFVFWNNPIPVAAGLILIDGKYLLARNQEWPSGFFSLISGFIEANETPEMAIKRETKEELGINALSVEFIGHYPFKPMNQLMITYVVKAEGEIKLSDELAEYQLLDESELAVYDFGALKLGKLVVDKWLGQKA